MQAIAVLEQPVLLDLIIKNLWWQPTPADTIYEPREDAEGLTEDGSQLYWSNGLKVTGRLLLASSHIAWSGYGRVLLRALKLSWACRDKCAGGCGRWRANDNYTCCRGRLN